MKQNECIEESTPVVRRRFAGTGTLTASNGRSRAGIMVERPLVRDDEELQIEENMAIVCHPGFLNKRMFVHNTDICLIESSGPFACLHSTLKQIFQID
jgi:hypothetical protein